MKDWFRKHKKGILAITSSVALYFILILVSVPHIYFEEDYVELNIAVALFYFVLLPIAAALPVLLYEFVKYLKRK